MTRVRCTKAIIPVAGYGTRCLPITKAIDKCMLPILNRPLVDYIVEDCLRAGITDFYFVTGKDAAQLRAYYSRKPALEAYLRAQHKEALADSIVPPPQARFSFCRARYGERSALRHHYPRVALPRRG